ncbi:serine/threonine protein phosphatase, partial [Streptomyces sp. A1136]
MTEYPTSQEGPQPVASGGGTDDAGHGKAPIVAAEAVRTHAQNAAGDPDGARAPGRSAELPRPRGGGGGGRPAADGASVGALDGAAGDGAGAYGLAQGRAEVGAAGHLHVEAGREGGDGVVGGI